MIEQHGHTMNHNRELTLSCLFLPLCKASQPSFLLYLRHAFRSPSGGGGLRKRDFGAIEYMLRRGDKMIGDVLEERGTKSISLPRGASEWWEAEVIKARGGGGAE